MITIYAPDAQDFSTLGLGALAPYECTVEEQAGGMYELTMTHPMDAEGKWLNIGVGCIIKAPAPVRETPLTEDGSGDTPTEVTRKIYKASNCVRLNLRRDASMANTPLGAYDVGTEVAVLSVEGSWAHVIVCKSGATGYMHTDYLTYVRDEVETITGDLPGGVIYPVQARGQLFRVVSVERDAAEREVRVTARHIFYDLLGNIVKNEYAPESIVAGTAVAQVFERALNPHGFTAHCTMTEPVTGEYTRRGLVECLLDPDDGVVPQTGARLVRDNYDVWVLKDEARETGVTIRHGKNMLGATLTTDTDDIVTRIIPVGQDQDGKPLLLSGTIYVDSPHINDYPIIYAQAIEYDVKVGDEGIGNVAQARAKLTELAQADFADNGVDLPTVGLDVDFVALGETEEYRAYADLEAVHLYDTVRVIAKSAGIDAAVRVTGYKWDALGLKYEGVTLGEIADLKTTVYGYEIPRGAVTTIKIANGAVGSAQLRDLAVQYAHIATAAIDELSANAITALKAYIAEIVAGSVTTDELYAGIAAIAVAQITTANIEQANIDWAQITGLQAGNIEALTAYIEALTAQSITTDELYAAYAHMFSLAADNIAAGSVSADSLAAVMADIIHAEVDVGEFGLAEVQNLLANALVLKAGQAGSMEITNLAVTQANMLNATIANLIIPGEDGKYYAVVVGTDGVLHTEEVTVTEGEIAAGETEDGRQIVATAINAESINGQSIAAEEAILNTVLTQALNAGKITAVEAMIASASIPTLYAASIKSLGDSIDISANESITLLVGDVAGAEAAAEFAAPYIGAEPPENAPDTGKLWLDEGVSPPVLRKWRGANVSTARSWAETVSSAAGGAASVMVDNAQGQATSMEASVAWAPRQAGTGTPSASNIRPISGMAAVTVTRSVGEDVQSVALTLPEAVYGGTLNAQTGEGARTWDIIASYAGETLPGAWLSDRDVYTAGTSPSTGAQVAYALAAPVPFLASGGQVLTAPVGQVVVASDADSITVEVVASGWETINDTGALREGIDAARSAIVQLEDEINLRVTKGELETFLQLAEEGVYIGRSDSMYRVLIDYAGVHIQQDGVDIAVFAKRTLITPYIRAGDPDAHSLLAWTRSADGGMALVRMEEIV